MMTLTINKKSFDINGNAIFNVTMELEGENITEAFIELTKQNKTLSNGTLNIKDYQFRVEDQVREILFMKYGTKEIEVIEDFR